MKQWILVSLLFSGNLAFGAPHELPGPLTCYHYRYNDPTGARDRSNLDAHPFMKIVAANFQSPAPSRQKVLVKALDEQGNVTAVDQALASMVINVGNDHHGRVERDLTIKVLAVTGKVIWKTLVLGDAQGMDSKYHFYTYWKAGSEDISCFERGHLPR